MVFSSPIFLFFFLPITLVLTYLTYKYKIRNLVLVILSVLFYVFGEGEMIFVMFGSITINYFIGNWIVKNKTKTPIIVGAIINLLVLIGFKYLSFIIENLNEVLALFGTYQLNDVKVKLPVGISFYTFHSLSYLIDVYRRQNTATKSFVDLALYISLFPQLIAGPIIRYKDVAVAIVDRKLSSHLFSTGIQRFIIGLGKKMIIANSLAIPADYAFGFSPHELTTPAAWFGILCYSMQLYFDFSAYSDMAIGLAKMLGFNFLENFHFPYSAVSIRDFWHRWHISLSNWFRDYLYIPLGGNKKGKLRTYLNLFIVFFLTGLWHGASWNFVIWGLGHGTFLVIERLGFEKKLRLVPSIFQHAYALLVVVILWVFFRAPDLELSIQYIQNLFGGPNTGTYTLSMLCDKETLFIFIAGVILSVNGFNRGLKFIYKNATRNSNSPDYIKTGFRVVRNIFLIAILCYSALISATGSYNPFIYFRF